LFLLALSLWTAEPARAQDAAPARTVHVAVRVLPPFVEQKDGSLTGFSVELWNAIAERLDVKTEFAIAPDVHAQLAAVQGGGADVGVGAISVTAERELRYDFSQPILNGGLQILVRSERASVESTAFQSLLSLLFSPQVLVWISIAIVLTIIPAHIVWFLERNQEDGIVRSKNYIPGIFQAFYWGLGALATQADAMPRNWIARIVALLWMFTGIVFVAFYTAQLTANLTVQQFKSEISGPADLPGKSVATIRASTSESWLRTSGVKTVSFATTDEAFKALVDKRVDAFVFDAPVLQYYASHAGAGHVRAVGAVFHNEDYAFAFRNDSDLRKPVNAALLAMREDGSYDDLAGKWFGAK
jgi:polar amino acid transport system substrate-binding protein